MCVVHSCTACSHTNSDPLIMCDLSCYFYNHINILVVVDHQYHGCFQLGPPLLPFWSILVFGSLVGGNLFLSSWEDMLLAGGGCNASIGTCTIQAESELVLFTTKKTHIITYKEWLKQ